MKTVAARAINVYSRRPDGWAPRGFSGYMAVGATNINILTLALFLYMIINDNLHNICEGEVQIL